jgi:hypothetical protein
MNERIKELANRLGPVATIGNWGRVEWADNVYPQLGDKMYASIDLEEFAELIVAHVTECVRDVLREEDSELTYTAAAQVQNRIKEFFGVEE